jgi:5-methylcytosine-specific restriction endonuclease McrA
MIKTQVKKICESCNVEFYVRKYRELKAKFCSRTCQNKLQYINKRVEYVCKGCNKTYTDSPCRKTKLFCSMECKTLISKTTRERRVSDRRARIARRGGKSSRVLRIYIFSIKKPQCEICAYDKYSYCLDLHHIDCNPNNNVESNIAILCALCHRQLHKGDLDYATQKRFLKRDNISQHKEITGRKLQTGTGNSHLFEISREKHEREDA